MTGLLLDEIKDLLARRGIAGDDTFKALFAALGHAERSRVPLPPMPKLPYDVRRRLDMRIDRCGMQYEVQAQQTEARFAPDTGKWIVFDFPLEGTPMRYEGVGRAVVGRPLADGDVLPALPPITLHQELSAIAAQHSISLPPNAHDAVEMLRRVTGQLAPHQMGGRRPGKWVKPPRPEPVPETNGDIVVQGKDGSFWTVRAGVATRERPGSNPEKVREFPLFKLPFEIASLGGDLRSSFDPDKREWVLFDPTSGRTFRGTSKKWREDGKEDGRPRPPRIDRAALPSDLHVRRGKKEIDSLVERFDDESGEWVLEDKKTGRMWVGFGLNVTEIEIRPEIVVA